MRVTPALRRVLSKAATNGFVMAVNGFGETTGRADAVKDPLFDRQSHIDKLINAGALTWGGGANQYVLTPAGEIALQQKASRHEA